jgi:hypothetical protein
VDWSKFFLFSWLVADDENEQLRRENEDNFDNDDQGGEDWPDR